MLIHELSLSLQLFPRGPEVIPIKQSDVLSRRDGKRPYKRPLVSRVTTGVGQTDLVGMPLLIALDYFPSVVIGAVIGDNDLIRKACRLCQYAIDRLANVKLAVVREHQHTNLHG